MPDIRQQVASLRDDALGRIAQLKNNEKEYLSECKKVNATICAQKASQLEVVVKRLNTILSSTH